MTKLHYDVFHVYQRVYPTFGKNAGRMGGKYYLATAIKSPNSFYQLLQPTHVKLNLRFVSKQDTRFLLHEKNFQQYQQKPLLTR